MPRSESDDPAEPPPSPPSARVEVTVRRDGPIVVSGPSVLDDGEQTTTAERLFLCRCGRSATKPLCDGTHKRTGFRAPGVEPPPRR